VKPGQDSYSVAVVGATGAVGREMLKTLEDRAFPVGPIRLLASPRSAGEMLTFAGRAVEVEALTADVPAVDVALFSAGKKVSREAGPRFAERGAVVIDNSSAFRMEPWAPLVVPEVNGARAFDALKNGRRIIANPNCSTIQLVVALKPLADAFGLERVIVSTYQSTSGAGQKGMDELSKQVVALLNGREPEISAFPRQVAFNCIPAIGDLRDDGYFEEEWKLVAETRRILERPGLRVVPTAVRVPTFACHAESVMVEFPRKVTAREVRAALLQAEGVTVRDRPAEHEYPTGAEHVGSDDVYVGRIRQAPDDDAAVCFWLVADNLRKGAALNAVQIAELLAEGPEEDA
jgi:aspartate-semialdehyde dehydrogenase